MIIGNGNISKAIEDREDLVFFASGVSDSSCTDESKFQREIDLLATIPNDKHVVYFSNLGVYRWSNPYIEHKIKMEQLVKHFAAYTIVRVEVIAWGRNPTTIHNYFRKQIAEGKPVQIQDTYRYVVEMDEFQYWLRQIKHGTQNEMNIPGRCYHVCDIYKMVKEGKL